MDDIRYSFKYRTVVVVLGVGAVVLLNIMYPPGPTEWPVYLHFSALVVVAELLRIEMRRGSLVMSFSLVLPLFEMHGTVASVTVFFVGILVGMVPRWQITYRNLFNASQFSLSQLMGCLAHALVSGRLWMTTGPVLGYPLATMVYVLVFGIVNHTLVQICLNLEADRGRLLWKHVVSNAREMVKWDWIGRAVTIPLGILMCWLYLTYGMARSAAISVPIFFVSYILRLHQRLTRANEELSILFQVGQRISSVLDLEALFGLIVESIERVVSHDLCTLYLWDEGENALRLVLMKHPTPYLFRDVRFPLGVGIVGSVAQSGRPEIVRDAASDPRVKYHPKDRHPARSMLLVPLLAEGKLVGEIVVGRIRPNAFAPADLKLLTILSSQAAVAVENATLYRRTESLATIDPMTGLYNYRYFYAKLSEELKRARWLGTPLSLLYIDMDNFKRLNDTYGHQVGDRALSDFAQILRSVLRETDTPVRYAGDEFVVVLRNTGPEQAEVIAQRILTAVRDHDFARGLGPARIELTVSAGVATFPVHALNDRDLINQADRAMYEGKQRGSNLVTVAQPLGS